MNQETKKMGLFSLISMGIGYVIGTGIFSMLPIAVALTGKSASLAAVAGAVLCLLATCIPAMFLSSVVDLPGGSYSQAVVFFPKVLAGAYGIIMLSGQLTFASVVISMTNYLVQLLPGLSDFQKIVSFVLLIAFFLLGIKGVSLSSKMQNVSVVILMLALGSFIVMGLPRVDFGTYFDSNYFSNGLSGFMSASSMMVFASIGGVALLSFSSQAKNPKKDIPLSMLITTMGVSVVYFLIGIVATGIIPLDEVIAAMNLGIVAEAFMSKPLYMFFMFGGCMFGLGTTLNGVLAAVPYPIMQLAEDGWLPKACLKRDKIFGYPYVTMGAVFIVGGVLPLFFGLKIDEICSIVGMPGFFLGAVLAIATMQIPKKFPNRWKKSVFHIPNVLLYALLLVSAASSVLLSYNMMKGIGTGMIVGIIVAVVVIFAYTYWRLKAGKVNIDYIALADDME